MRWILHSLAGLILLGSALLFTAGCTAKKDAGKGPDAGKKEAKKDAHDHPHEGPHEGALAEWGEEKYHAEFTVDHKKKMATVYILDGTAKKAAPIPAETITLTLTNAKPSIQIVLKADPEGGDPKGQASRFSGTHDQLAIEMEFKGEISGQVGGTPYTGTFEEKEHDHKKDKK